MDTDTTVEVSAPVSAPTADSFEAAIAGYDVTTSDGSREEAPAAADKQAEPAAKTDDAPAEPKPAWVTWTEEGGFRVKPGKGFTIAEDGSVIFDPEVAQRMANKRVGRTREEERAAARRRIEEVERKYQAELEALKKGGTTPAQEPGKPWAAKGAPEPAYDDFDTVPEYTKAMLEWDRAQRADGPPTKADDKQAADQGAREPNPFDAAVKDLFEAGVAKFEDFDAVAGPIELSAAVLEATMASDQAPDLLYFYGKHPEVADELNDLEGYPLLVAIAKAEARMTATMGGNNGSHDTRQQQGTPPPKKEVTPVINPVRPGASPRRSLSDLAADDDADGFYAHLANELK